MESLARTRGWISSVKHCGSVAQLTLKTQWNAGDVANTSLAMTIFISAGRKISPGRERKRPRPPWLTLPSSAGNFRLCLEFAERTAQKSYYSGIGAWAGSRASDNQAPPNEGFHPHRIAGRNRHHRDPRGDVAAGACPRQILWHARQLLEQYPSAIHLSDSLRR